MVPNDSDRPDVNNCKKIRARAWRPWFAKATAKRYLKIPPEGAWTLLIQGRPCHKWGFYVNNDPKKPDHYVKWRPLRYFHKFGIIQDEKYTGET